MQRKAIASAAWVCFAALLAGVAAAQQSPDGGGADDTLANVAAALEDVAKARPCASIADDRERLACYDQALRGTETVRADDSRPPAVPESRAGAASRATPSEPDPRRGQSERLPTAVAAERSPADSPSAAASGDDADEGAERIVTVVEIRTGVPNEAVFVTNDGQVWEQTDSRRFSAPKVPFEARIRSGALGSYFLVPPGGGRAVRVRQH